VTLTAEFKMERSCLPKLTAWAKNYAVIIKNRPVHYLSNRIDTSALLDDPIKIKETASNLKSVNVLDGLRRT